MHPYLIWDWNGTLFDDRRILLRSMAAAVTAHGTVIGPDAVAAVGVARPMRAYFERVLGRELSEQQWRSVDTAFRTHYAALAREGELAAGAREALAAHHALGGKQALVSQWRHEELVPIVRSCGVLGYFDEVIGRRGAEDKATLVERHLLRHRLDRRTVVLLGDTREDMIAAGTCGVRSVLVLGASLEPTRRRTVPPSPAVPMTDSLVEAVQIARDLVDLEPRRRST